MSVEHAKFLAFTCFVLAFLSFVVLDVRWPTNVFGVCSALFSWAAIRGAHRA